MFNFKVNFTENIYKNINNKDILMKLRLVTYYAEIIVDL